MKALRGTKDEAEDIILEHADMLDGVELILTQNDYMASGASAALDRLKQRSGIKILGADGFSGELLLSGVRSKADIHRARQLLRQCRRELDAEGKSYRKVSVGTEIDSPASVFLTDILASESDLLLLDGHSLVRSTIAGPSDDALPSYRVLTMMLQHAVTIGHQRGCSVIFSGDLEAFPQAVQPLLNLGVDELSVPLRSLGALFRLCQAPAEPAL